MKRIFLLVLIFSTICFFNGCVTLSSYSNKLNKIKIGMTKDEVIKIIGNPKETAANEYNDEIWEYSQNVWGLDGTNPAFNRDMYTIIMFYEDKVIEVLKDSYINMTNINWKDSQGFIKAQRAKDEAEAKKLGYPSVEAYNEVVKRQSFGNFITQLSFGVGIPFVKGDVFNVPAGMLIGIERNDTNKGIIYLVRLSANASSKAIYILTTNELKIINSSDGSIIYETLKLKYKQPAQYRQGVQNINSWLFEKIK